MAFFATPGVSASRTAQLGQVATRCKLPVGFFATNKQFQSRSFHVAMDDIVTPKIVLPGFYVANFSYGATYQETKIGANSIYTAAIEYPSGTMTQVKWNGVATVTCPDGGFVESDAVTGLFIPRGATFFVRIYYTNTAGVIFIDKASTHYNTGGDQLTAAVSGITDNTMSGAYGTDDINNSFAPLAIVSQTTRPSVVCITDSRGVESDTSDATGAYGEHARSLAPSIAYANYAVRGDGASKFLASCTNRVTLAQKYFTHMTCNYGINDIEQFSRNANQVMNDRLQISALTGLPMLHSTILPHANGGNTAANNAGFEAVRVAFNRMARNRADTLTEQVVDSAVVVEAVPDQPVWTASYSTDFLHPNQTGYLALAAAGQINALTFIK
jgi:lysophospholipase L1-like esterase